MGPLVKSDNVFPWLFINHYIKKMRYYFNIFERPVKKNKFIIV